MSTSNPTLLLCLIVGLAGVSVTAQPESVDSPRRPGPPSFEALDADGDGVLTREEWNTARQRLRGQDARGRVGLRNDNRGGSDREGARAGVRKPRGERRDEILNRFDSDGDGRLSETERTALREERREKIRDRVLERFDADGDGALTGKERRMARDARNPRSRNGCDRCRRGRPAGPPPRHRSSAN